MVLQDLAERQVLSNPRENFLRLMSTYQAPKAIQTYLSTIGDFVDWEGNKSEWEIPDGWWPTSDRPAGCNVAGFFTRVAANNHFI